MPEDLREPWAQVIANWDDDKAHRRFVTLCAATGRLAEAGACYREIVRANDERQPEAQRRIQAILLLAIDELQAQRTQSPARARRIVHLLAFGLSTLMCVSALWLLWSGL